MPVNPMPAAAPKPAPVGLTALGLSFHAAIAVNYHYANIAMVAVAQATMGCAKGLPQPGLPTSFKNTFPACVARAAASRVARRRYESLTSATTLT